MRKVMIALLTLALLCSLASCGGEDVSVTEGKPVADLPTAGNTEPVSETKPLNTAVAGYWEMIRIDSDNPDEAVTEEEVAAAREQGVPMYLELMEDGAGIFCFEEASAIIWNNDSITVLGDDTFDYEVEGNRLMIDMWELVCVFRRAEIPYSRDSEMEEAGFTEFMEEGETYPYTTICSNDQSKLTTGEATVIAYEIFASADGYPEKEGYEWRVATMEVRFFDENAQTYGPYAFSRYEDYYCVKLHDDTDVEQDESDAYECYTQTRIYCGQEVETCVRISDSWSDWVTDASGNYACYYNIEFAFQVPEGYDGAVAVLADGSYELPENSYITDCDPEYFLMFRLN